MTDLERIKRLETAFLLFIAVHIGETETGPIHPYVNKKEELGQLLQEISDDL